jgi:hypothetical protein
MIDRVAFLLARIAEDEASARMAVAQNQGGEAWLADRIGSPLPGRTAASMVIISEGGDLWDCQDSSDYGMAPAHAQHIARWDPGRVLTECRAKRRVVAEIADHGRLSYECKRMLLETLAQPYIDHPDFREDWRHQA